MSLAGKILAILNVLGAIALLYFASQDYATRQAWAYSVYRHDLLINGLPVDAQELGDDGEPISPRVAEDDKSALFQPVGGDPVATQSDEVARVKKILDGKVEAASGDRGAQTYVLARILLPLTSAYHEREQLLACRYWFQPGGGEQFKKLCQAAFLQAVQPDVPQAPPQAFADVFRARVRERGGEPAEAFVSLLLRSLGNDRAKAKQVNFDQAWDAAVEAQRAGLKHRYDAAFAVASSGESASKLGQPSQRVAIARLLFGLCPFLADETLSEADRKGLEGPIPAEAQKKFQTQVERVIVVCGLKSTVGAISQRAGALRQLIADVQAGMISDRQQFVADHGLQLELLRAMAALVRADELILTETKESRDRFDTVVKERKKEIEAVQEDYKQKRLANGEDSKKLRDLSQEVLNLRLRIRDAITANEKGESRIRELETKATGLDRRASK